jgi:hypothetical protein
MPRKIIKGPKFIGALAKRIKMPPARVLTDGRLMTDEELQADTRRAVMMIFEQRMDKMHDLLCFYGWKPQGRKFGEAKPGELIVALFRMACDFVPGFQVTENGGTTGRPAKHDAESLKTLITIIDHAIKPLLSKKYGRPATDLEACELWAECSDSALAGAANASARKKAAKTATTLLSHARASEKRKAAGKVH